MTLQLLHSEFPNVWEKFDFYFITVQGWPSTTPEMGFYLRVSPLQLQEEGEHSQLQGYTYTDPWGASNAPGWASIFHGEPLTQK